MTYDILWLLVRISRYCLSLWLAVLSVLASSSDVGWLSGALTVLLARCQSFCYLERYQSPHQLMCFYSLGFASHGRCELNIRHWVVFVFFFCVCVYQVIMQWWEDHLPQTWKSWNEFDIPLISINVMRLSGVKRNPSVPALSNLIQSLMPKPQCLGHKMLHRKNACRPCDYLLLFASCFFWWCRAL